MVLMAHFKVSPQILARLGEELISSFEQSVIELVKNSYDADATGSIITLHETRQPGGNITISDDGSGMDATAITERWLLIGRSQKSITDFTPKYKRPLAGSKGLGRLAALRQGAQVTLGSRPESEPGVEYFLTIDWKALDNADSVDEIDLDIKQRQTDKKHGTDVFIQNLHRGLSDRDVKKLARELILLSDPFGDPTGFCPVLIAPEFTELEQRVRSAYFDVADYYLHASLSPDGTAQFTLQDFKGQVITKEDQHNPNYPPLTASFELWVFVFSGEGKKESFSVRNVGNGEVQEWLKTVGNVSLYHRGLRVRPYGDPEDDWLEINKLRGRNPMTRPGTNSSVGKISVEDPDGFLMLKTDRLGFVDNENFQQLKAFGQDALRWMANFRGKEVAKEADFKRAVRKRQVHQNVALARETLKQAIDENVPTETRPVVQDAYQKFEVAVEREYETFQNDIQLYRSLATVGTTAATFAHESGHKIDKLDKVTSRLSRTAQRELKDRFANTLAEPIGQLHQAIISIKDFVQFPLHLLRRQKRKSEAIDVCAVVRETASLFELFLQETSHVELEVQNVCQELHIYGSIALLESILANLLTNARNAFRLPGSPLASNRRVVIRIEEVEGTIVIRVMDNSVGIQLDIEDIWLAGVTTTPDGSGLGLTIARDCAHDLGGDIAAIAKGETGGAEFIVRIPAINYARLGGQKNGG